MAAGGTSSKALRILGLSKLPPDASRAQHLDLIRQHRSVRKECVKSSTPLALHRRKSSNPKQLVSGQSAGETMPPTPSARQLEWSSELTCHGTGRGGSVGGDFSGVGAGSRGDKYNSNSSEGRGQDDEDLDDGKRGMVRASSLRLSPSDLDEQFLRTIDALMAQFPEPPTRDPVTELNSPATPLTASAARNGMWRGDRRGVSSSKALQHWLGGGGGRGVGGGERNQHGKQERQQNPMFQQQQQQQIDRRPSGSSSSWGVHEINGARRTEYSQRDTFEL